MKKKVKKKTHKKFLITFAFVFLVLGLVSAYTINEKNKEKNLKLKEKQEKQLVEKITSHYNTIVKTNKEAKVYDSNEKETGLISDNVELSLKEITITKDTKYFEIVEFEGYHIKYEDVEPIDKNSEKNTRYKNYIPFNENVITNEMTSFYNKDDKLIYKFNKSFDLPIIIKETEKYGVEFNNELLYIKEEDIKEVKENNNTDLEKTNSIRVIVYHSFYDKNVASEAWCRNSICHSTEQIESHSKYISENNYFTLTMNELEMYIDGKINFPKKSVFITIDDGLLAERGIAVLEKYQLNASVFLITSYYTPEYYGETKYIEFHSHGHNIHNVGQCPGGQGGGIKCLEEKLLLEDLTSSREKLNGSTAFCYPFYEYNNYSIKMLKEAGFTMAFAGLRGDGKVHVGTDKFQIPRYTLTSDVKVSQLANIIK